MSMLVAAENSVSQAISMSLFLTTMIWVPSGMDLHEILRLCHSHGAAGIVKTISEFSRRP
jgi:hypothetical protein